jgi:hypothetical protein
MELTAEVKVLWGAVLIGGICGETKIDSLDKVKNGVLLKTPAILCHDPANSNNLINGA